jgi:hypothetical protein
VLSLRGTSALQHHNLHPQDFDAAALGKVTLRATPKHLPWKALVEVRGACNATGTSRRVAGSARQLASFRGSGSVDAATAAAWAGGDAYGGPAAPDSGSPLWHEGSLTWSTAPFIGDDEPSKVTKNKLERLYRRRLFVSHGMALP